VWYVEYMDEQYRPRHSPQSTGEGSWVNSHDGDELDVEPLGDGMLQLLLCLDDPSPTVSCHVPSKKLLGLRSEAAAAGPLWTWQVVSLPEVWRNIQGLVCPLLVVVKCSQSTFGNSDIQPEVVCDVALGDIIVLGPVRQKI
jgi:hypothetical protein